MEDLKQILDKVYDSIEKPLVDARFGDQWKDSYIAQNFSKEELREMAWRQGRRAILLEQEVEKLLNK